MVIVRDGEHVVLTGAAVDDSSGQEWASGMDWVARPAEECVTDRGWVVVDLEVPSGGP